MMAACMQLGRSLGGLVFSVSAVFLWVLQAPFRLIRGAGFSIASVFLVLMFHSFRVVTRRLCLSRSDFLFWLFPWFLV